MMVTRQPSGNGNGSRSWIRKLIGSFALIGGFVILASRVTQGHECDLSWVDGAIFSIFAIVCLALLLPSDSFSAIVRALALLLPNTSKREK